MSHPSMANTGHPSLQPTKKFQYPRWRKSYNQENQLSPVPINTVYDRTLSVLYESSISDGSLITPHFAIEEDRYHRRHERRRSASPTRFERGIEEYRERKGDSRSRYIKSIGEDHMADLTFAPRKWSEMVDDLVKKHTSGGPTAVVPESAAMSQATRYNTGDGDSGPNCRKLSHIEEEHDLDLFDNGKVEDISAHPENHYGVQPHLPLYYPNDSGYFSLCPLNSSPRQGGPWISCTAHNQEDSDLGETLLDRMQNAQNEDTLLGFTNDSDPGNINQDANSLEMWNKQRNSVIKLHSSVGCSESAFIATELDDHQAESLTNHVDRLEDGDAFEAAGILFKTPDTQSYEWSTTIDERISAIESLEGPVDWYGDIIPDNALTSFQYTANGEFAYADDMDIDMDSTAEYAEAHDSHIIAPDASEQQITNDTARQDNPGDIIVLSQQELTAIIECPADKRTTYMVLLSEAIKQLPREECMRQIQIFANSEASALSAFMESQTRYVDTDGIEKTDFVLGPGWKRAEIWMALRVVMQVLDALLEPFRKDILLEDEVRLKSELQSLVVRQDHLERVRHTAEDVWNILKDPVARQAAITSYQRQYGPAWQQFHDDIHRVKNSNTKRNELLEVTGLDPSMFQQMVCVAEKVSLLESDMNILLILLKRIYSVVAYTSVNNGAEESDLKIQPRTSNHQPIDITPCFMEILRDEAKRDEQGEARGEMPWNNGKCTESCFQIMTEQLIAEKTHPKYQNRFCGAEMMDALIARIQRSQKWNHSRYMKTRHWDSCVAESNNTPRDEIPTSDSDDEVELIIRSPVRLKPLGPCPYVNKPKGCRQHRQNKCQYRHENEGIYCRSGQKCDRGENCYYLHSDCIGTSTAHPNATVVQRTTDFSAPVRFVAAIPPCPTRPCPKVNAPEGCYERDACPYGHFNESKTCQSVKTGKACIFGDKCAYLHPGQDRVKRNASMTDTHTQPQNLRLKDLRPILNDVVRNPKRFNVCMRANTLQGCDKSGRCMFNHSLEGVPCRGDDGEGSCALGQDCPLWHRIPCPASTRHGDCSCTSNEKYIHESHKEATQDLWVNRKERSVGQSSWQIMDEERRPMQSHAHGSTYTRQERSAHHTENSLPTPFQFLDVRQMQHQNKRPNTRFDVKFQPQNQRRDSNLQNRINTRGAATYHQLRQVYNNGFSNQNPSLQRPGEVFGIQQGFSHASSSQNRQKRSRSQLENDNDGMVDVDGDSQMLSADHPFGVKRICRDGG